ncbi:MAG: glycosyltransferase family 39 protein [Pyrinomonadaceae bacterium]
MPLENHEGAFYKTLSLQILPATTAGFRPDYFSADYFLNRKLVIAVLAIFIIAGFGLRVGNLGTESLSEDELNKLQTVAEYRTNGISGRNGEHPFLMKGLQTISITVAEKINNQFFFAAPDRRISEEAALRFPTALFGSVMVLLLFLFVNELFGSSIALIAAALWAVDPNAVGFDRIAKEDSFLLFFFLLANIFWIRGQTKAELGEDNIAKYIVLTAISLGAMLASKYLLHPLFIGLAYFTVIRTIPSSRWCIDKNRWYLFYILIGVGFIVFNPTILLPETWREMFKFSSEQRIGHDAYEFAGNLYRNKMTLWFAGVPWTFYYVFILCKTPLLTLFFCLCGLPLLFTRKLGDGRIFLFVWIGFWFMPFTVLGGKFTRYFTLAEPLVLILAAIGCFVISKWLADKFFPQNFTIRNCLKWFLPALMILLSFMSSLLVAPHFRLYINQIGGQERAGFYFPHDEFYDTSTREAAAEIASRARQGVTVAVETPYLYQHYLRKAGREDLNVISLSDKSRVTSLAAGDFVLAAKGRRYFSNEAYLNYLENNLQTDAEIKINGITSVKIYRLDESAAEQIRNAAKN